MSNTPTFATLYQVVKHIKDTEQKTVMKAERNVLQRLIIMERAGQLICHVY